MHLSLAEFIDEVMGSLPDFAEDARGELVRALESAEAKRVHAVRRALERVADRATEQPSPKTPDG